MYRITIYEYNNKTIEETQDGDEFREIVQRCVVDLENKNISSFVASRIAERQYNKPFWEK